MAEPAPDRLSELPDLEAAQSLGYVRETNYGRLFDVAVVADPANCR
jgi:hypothetical protein